MTDLDIKTVFTALQTLRNMGRNHCHGGLENYYATATDGLAALARIEERLKPRQPPLLFPRKTSA